MFEVHIKTPSDLSNDYKTIVELIQKKEHVIIGNNGKVDVVLISPKDYEDYDELRYRYFLYKQIQEYRADTARRSDEQDNYYAGMEKRLGIGLDKESVDRWMVEELERTAKIADDPNAKWYSYEEVFGRLMERMEARDNANISQPIEEVSDAEDPSSIDVLHEYHEKFHGQIKYQQKFDDDWRELFTKRVRENVEFGGNLWAALANVRWHHKDDPNKNVCGASSFRVAGSLINSMLCFSDYTDWLFDDFDAGVVSEEIACAMAGRGWIYEI